MREGRSLVVQCQRRGHRNLIHRVLDVLGAFTPERPEMTLTSISRHTDLPLATVHRLVGELVHWGALERGEDGCYRLTVKIWQLSRATPGIGELSRAAMPALSDLYQLTGRPAQLTILDGKDAVVIASIDGAGEIDGEQPLRQVAYLSSAGLVLLAHAPWQLQEEVLASRPLAATRTDRPSQDMLRRVFADVRLRGLAVCRNDRLGGELIATAVRDASASVVAAVTVVAGWNGEVRQRSVALLAAAREIGLRIGYRDGPHLQFPSRGVRIPEERARPDGNGLTMVAAVK